MKAILILNSLSFAPSYMSITELSASTGLSAGTLHRILQEMVECGLVLKGGDKKYKIGYEAISLAMRMKSTNYLEEASREEMIRLNDLTRETVHIITIDEYWGVYVGKLDAKNQIGLRSRVGKHLPLYCSGGGKVLIANQGEKWINEYLNHVELKGFTQNTITTRKEMEKEIEKIRKDGFALDNMEHNPDVVCIAAPVFDNSEKAVCSIGISAPSYRFSKELALSYAEEIVKSAKAISRKLKGE